ncbi:sigma-70 family RNA polymerase sigma factor [Streptomyces sp. NPDC003038]|uniref:sigma-70 family RNA polymerase sigma factor n=1 Tax=unclassified Streptomyces TaxID=2593676 RepID=UPI0033B3CE78
MVEYNENTPPGIIGESLHITSDAELTERARAGNTEAFAELFRRYWDAAVRLAASHVQDTHIAQDLAAESFVRVFQILKSGGGPETSFRCYLNRVLHNLSTEWGKNTRRWVLVPDVSLYETQKGNSAESKFLKEFDHALVIEALCSLPERWKIVLWYTVIQGYRPATLAGYFGISPNSVSALTYRAKEGLRQAYLTIHVNRAKSEALCAYFIERLAAYSRARLIGLAAEETARHLESCRSCERMFEEIQNLNSFLRR